MSDRPVDISLLCALLVVLAGAAFAGLVPTLSALGAVREASQFADRVAWFLGVVAVVRFVMVLLGLIAAITLWSGQRLGLALGLLFLAAWNPPDRGRRPLDGALTRSGRRVGDGFGTG